MKDNKPCFLIDVCGTLFNSNTTFDFVRYYFGHRRIVSFWFSWPYRIYNRLMDRLLHREPLRHNLIALLRGIDRDQLSEMADTFWKDYLVARENQSAFHSLDHYRQMGARLVIVSATIDVIAQTVARHYPVDAVLSTRLAYTADGVCKGKIACDLLGHKQEALTRAGINPPYAGIITDNYSDLDLINVSEKPLLVIYKNTKNKWKQILTEEKYEQSSIICV